MKRVLVSLAVLALVCPLGAQRGALKPGVERWSIKTSLVATATKAKPVDLADLLALPDATGVKHNDARYQDARIPEQQGNIGKEGDLITVHGWLHLAALETDGDYHIQISNSQTDGNNCLVVEVPDPDPAFVQEAAVRDKAAAVRLFLRQGFFHDPTKEPSSSGSVMAHPAFVALTGALFYDDSHVNDQPRGKKGMKAATLWELHPVTAMSFAKP